jgi:hypothetical protein
MRNSVRLFFFLGIPILMCNLLLASCASAGKENRIELKPESEGSGPIIRITGTVRYLPIEGGLFVIRDQEGSRYNPLNLPPEYRIDGLAVEATARRREDLLSVGMVGPIVELLQIRKLPNEKQ